MPNSAKPSGVITITTDFGHQGPFVGVMKGVHPDALPRGEDHRSHPRDRRALAGRGGLLAGARVRVLPARDRPRRRGGSRRRDFAGDRGGLGAGPCLPRARQRPARAGRGPPPGCGSRSGSKRRSWRALACTGPAPLSMAGIFSPRLPPSWRPGAACRRIWDRRRARWCRPGWTSPRWNQAPSRAWSLRSITSATSSATSMAP